MSHILCLGPNGKYACISSVFVSDQECPDDYFINAPGDKDTEAKLTLSEYPISLWCTESPRDNKKMCGWSAGREKESDMHSDQSLVLDRGRCKKSYHCKNQGKLFFL